MLIGDTGFQSDIYNAQSKTTNICPGLKIHICRGRQIHSLQLSLELESDNRVWLVVRNTIKLHHNLRLSVSIWVKLVIRNADKLYNTLGFLVSKPGGQECGFGVSG